MAFITVNTLDGSLAGGVESKPASRTLADAILVCLSAANTLHQRLSEIVAVSDGERLQAQIDPLRPFADAAGRFADACEKIDHLEPVPEIASKANADIARWIVLYANELSVDLNTEIVNRRIELKKKQFFIEG